MNKPVGLDLTRTQAEEAITHWLSTVVFRNEVTVKSVSWESRDNLFHIVFQTETDED